MFPGDGKATCSGIASKLISCDGGELNNDDSDGGLDFVQCTPEVTGII